MKINLVQAKMINNHNWILFNMNTGEPIGEERAYRYRTRKEAYAAAEKMWPSNSVWKGKRTNNGYTFAVE